MPKRKKLVIFGAGHAPCLKPLDAINRIAPTWEMMGFLDDTPEKQGKSFWGYAILGDRRLIPELASDPDVYFFNNVRSHWSRTLQITELLDSHGCRIASLVSSAQCVTLLICRSQISPLKGFVPSFSTLIADQSCSRPSLGC